MQFRAGEMVRQLAALILVWWWWGAAAAGLTEAATDPTDLKVLKELLANVGGTAALPSWSGNDPCGDNWHYIQCDGSSVTGIQLQNTNLQGQLPPSLNQMSNLQHIALQGNNFTGPLPSLAGLALLQTAYMDGQSFTSIPPDFFSGLTSVTLISLDYSPLNQSSGGWSLPDDLAKLAQLTTLSLTQTCLSGSLPDFLASLPNLANVRLAYNLLTGSIPPSYSGAPFVSFQVNNQLSRAKLTGSIAPVGGMLSLQQLWVHVNAFSGTIPPSLGTLPSLLDCRLNDNQLVGPIPSTFSASTSLAALSVRHNNLDGPVPAIPSVNPENYTTDGNYFCTGKIGGACDPEVTALLAFLGGVGYPVTLVQSWIGNDACAGWTGITCEKSTGKVITVNLPSRSLTGHISPDIANLTSLQNLVLSKNNLTGTIPASLAKLPSLRRLSLPDNNLFSPVPSFSSSVTVDLSGNPNLAKDRPAAAPAPASSSPSSPSPVVRPPSSTTPSTPSTSSPSISPPSSSSPTTNGTDTTGSSNSPPLNGTPAIPSTPAKGHKSSTIPAVAGSIAGAICIAFIAGLLLLILVKKRRKVYRVQSNNSLLIHPSTGSSGPELVKLSLGNRVADVSQAHSNADSASSDVQVVEAGNLLISIQVLRNVTNNFSSENVLGKGGFGVVYKGELDDGTKIAVKRMEASVVSNKGLNEFQSEIAVLTKVRHRHLVALLGYCIDGNERLLVYEYMPLGTLSQHLFDYAKLGLPPLSLKRRLSIALDVARGMEYLHGLAHTSFIHRDLKPSNILLGDEYRAKVSDFGLVKLASDDKSSVETRLAGTFGYLAPEYAVTGRVTTKSDVFSFGVVLMELISGRKALDETQPEESVHLVAWFKRLTASKDDFLKALDPTLDVTNESLPSIRAAAELAGHCTLREAWQRPDMSHAVNVLSPLVEQWKPADVDGDDGIGIDLDMTLPQALKKWQAYEGASSSSTSAFFSRSDLDDTNGSMPSRPTGFADSFTSSDGR